MGNPKQKWTEDEENALRAGIAKHGTGKWKNIQKDPEFHRYLHSRSNIDLKDKWRNMSVSINGLPRDKPRTPKLRLADSPASPMPISVIPACPMPISQVPGSSSKAIVLANPTPTDVIMEDASKCSVDVTTAPKYNALIYEALSTLKDPNGPDSNAIASFIEQRQEVPQNFRKVLTARLRRLVQQDKIEKVQHCFRLKTEGGTSDPLPKLIESQPRLSPVRPRQSPINFNLGGTLEEAAVAAAYKVAEAENKSFVAAEAVKELERVTRMAEEAEAFLRLAQQIYERCAAGDIVKVQ